MSYPTPQPPVTGILTKSNGSRFYEMGKVTSSITQHQELLVQLAKFLHLSVELPHFHKREQWRESAQFLLDQVEHSISQLENGDLLITTPPEGGSTYEPG